MVLKDIPADARPREKLLAQGAAALADAELIALLLRTGLQGVPEELARNGGWFARFMRSAEQLEAADEPR